MAASYLDYFIHTANILMLLSYSVRDILWLRCLAVASALAAMPYFLGQPTPLWPAFLWSVVFTIINIYQAARLILERRPVKLSPEEEQVRQLAFRDLAPRELLRLLSIGSWTNAGPDERLIPQGRPADSLSFIVRGKVKVTQDGRNLGDLGPGQIVGSALLLTGAESAVDAVTVESSRLLQWEAKTLEQYLNAHSETRSAFQRHLVRDLAGKVQHLGVQPS